MEEQPGPYVHRFVEGLPASLIAKEGKTFAAIALMQRHAGVNRETRRELQSGVKVYLSDKVAGGDDSAQQKTIVLKPLNPAFQPIVVDGSEEGAVRAIAEFVRVL